MNLKKRAELPSEYRILPHAVSLRVPGFDSQYRPEIETLIPCSGLTSEDWFEQFSARVFASVGQSFLPICRISDGEFRFLLGPQPLGPMWPFTARVLAAGKQILNQISRDTFVAGGRRGGKLQYDSGRYSSSEWGKARLCYSTNLRWLAQRGILAAHLTFGAPKPFQQHYFPSFGNWLRLNSVELTCGNYVPFYFVYAFLATQAARLFKGKRVLVVHGATDCKRERIIERLTDYGAKVVTWAAISNRRSMFDKIDAQIQQSKFDLCVVGAGIGKPMIFRQLESVQGPCIDAGYMFEVWDSVDAAGKRAYTLPDACATRTMDCFMHLTPSERRALRIQGNGEDRRNA